jgi:hypothetical protein
MAGFGSALSNRSKAQVTIDDRPALSTGVAPSGVAARRLWTYACRMKTQALMVNAPHTSETAMDAARARRRFIKLMEHRFGPLPSRDKSRVMAASTAMLATMEDRLVDAASVREVFFA